MSLGFSKGNIFSSSFNLKFHKSNNIFLKTSMRRHLDGVLDFGSQNLEIEKMRKFKVAFVFVIFMKFNYSVLTRN